MIIPFLWNRVVSARMSRMTSHDSFYAEHAPFYRSVLPDCFNKICRACRCVSAHGRKQGRYEYLIESYKKNYDLTEKKTDIFHDKTPLVFFNTATIDCITSSHFTSVIVFLATTTRSYPGSMTCPERRNASLMSLAALCLFTLFPTFLLARNDILLYPSLFFI